MQTPHLTHHVRGIRLKRSVGDIPAHKFPRAHKICLQCATVQPMKLNELLCFDVAAREERVKKKP